MQKYQTTIDLIHRNNHFNPFQFKIPSHHASKNNIVLFIQGYIIRKLSLIPLDKSSNIVKLYQICLQQLIQASKQYVENKDFIQNLIYFLKNWQIYMKKYQTWPYTRLAFYSLQNNIKQQKMRQNVALERALLQPNKIQFYKKATGNNYKSQQLNILLKTQQQSKQIPQNRVEQIQKQIILPQDIVFLDTDTCWLQLQNNYQSFQLQQLKDWLQQYTEKAIFNYIYIQLKNNKIKNIIQGLKLRAKVFDQILGYVPQIFDKLIQKIQYKNNQ